MYRRKVVLTELPKFVMPSVNNASAFFEVHFQVKLLSDVNRSAEPSQVGGDEDIPEGVVAVLSKTDMDVLCHAAVRARATGALLACCTDSELLDPLYKFVGTYVKVQLENGNVTWGPSGAASVDTTQAASKQEARLSLLPRRDKLERCASVINFSKHFLKYFRLKNVVLCNKIL